MSGPDHSTNNGHAARHAAVWPPVCAGRAKGHLPPQRNNATTQTPPQRRLPECCACVRVWTHGHTMRMCTGRLKAPDAAHATCLARATCLATSTCLPRDMEHAVCSALSCPSTFYNTSVALMPKDLDYLSCSHA
eukprot:134064-Chlamydomonas_euryale.AAC.1